MVKISKRYRTATESAELSKPYSLDEAIMLLKKMSPAKFDETVELSVHLGVDPKKSDQMVRGSVNLPHGSGKKVTIIVFTETPQVALDAGADFAGLDDLIKKIQDGWLGFTVAVSTPTAMKEVRKIARILGPRGLMPNPKSGTVSEDVEEAINAIKLGGRIEYKMDKTANLGIVVGKRSFNEQQLNENIKSVIEAIGRSRPTDIKGKFILNMALTSTMSPGIKLESDLFAKL